MKHGFTYLILLLLFVGLQTAQAQQPLHSNRVLWTTPLSASPVRTVVDANGSTWVLNSPNTFQLIDPLGKVSWTKAISSLSVADFTIDKEGQLLLIGSPSTGKPVLEKYDASQALIWRNTLDSLSNVPGQAGNLSVTINPIGSGIALGTNSGSNQKLSYYFFSADGKVSTPVSLTGTKAASVEAIRPVLVNTNDMLLGINQSGVTDAMPILYRLQVKATSATQVPAGTPEGVHYALQASYQSYPYPPSFQRVLPLLSDGRIAYSIFKAAVDTTKLQPAPSAKRSGTAFFEFTAGSEGQYQVPVSEFGTTDINAIGESVSQVLDASKTLHTIQVIRTPSSGSSADFVLNQYVLQPNTGNKRFVLLNSVKLGSFSSAIVSTSTGVGLSPSSLSILKRTADGALLLSGMTTGTATIGQRTFVGAPDKPTNFLLSLAPDVPDQTLTNEQVNWIANLPTTVRKVVSNARQQSWVQLADSTYRYYNSKGSLVWEKKLVTQGIYDFGADSRGNLYIMSADSVNAFDSTGTFRWKQSHKKGPDMYGRKLYIKPEGGGLATGITNSFNGYQRLTEFNSQGQETGAVDTWNWTGNPRTSVVLQTILPAAANQFLFFFANYNEPRFGASSTSILNYASAGTAFRYATESGAYRSATYPVNLASAFSDPSTGGFYIWSGADQKSTYLVQSQRYRLSDSFSDGIYGYSFTKFDSTGNNVLDEFNTVRVNRIALAKTVAINPVGTLYILRTAFRAENATTTSYDLILSEQSSTLALRNTTRLGTFTLASGQTDNTSLTIVQAYTDGSLLVSGTTNGTLTMGANSFAGSTAAPTRFMTLINTVITQVTAPASAVCAGTTATVKARYKGYIDQVPTLQLADSKGSLLLPGQTVPLSASALVDSTLTTLSLPIPATLATGIYQVRTLLGTLASPWSSLSVTAKPTALTVNQQGDELVSSTATAATYQWYDAQNKPISGATDARFKPQASGSYYVVATANGCNAAPSASVNYLITATEPTVGVELYPNPAAERLLVRWPQAGANARIRLLTTQGRVVQDVPRQGELTNVPTQGLADGMVLVQLQAEGQTTLVRKVLIQR